MTRTVFRRIVVTTAAVTSLFLLVSCATVKIASRKGDVPEGPYSSLLVVSTFPSEEVRRGSEEALAARLKERGLRVVTATAALDSARLPTAEEITGLLKESDLAGILVLAPEEPRLAREAPDGGDGIRVGTWRMTNGCDPPDLDTRFLVYKENNLGRGLGTALESMEFRVRILDRESGACAWEGRTAGLSEQQDLYGLLLSDVIPALVEKMGKEGVI